MGVCPRGTSDVVLSCQDSAAYSAAVQDVEKLRFKSILDEQQIVTGRRELAEAKDHADVMKDMLDGAQVCLQLADKFRLKSHLISSLVCLYSSDMEVDDKFHIRPSTAYGQPTFSMNAAHFTLCMC